MKKHVYKVQPVRDKIPAFDEDWDLSTYKYQPSKGLSDKYGDRKVLLVKYAFPDRGRGGGSLEEGDASYPPKTNSAKDEFFIDVPPYFFQKLSEGKLGNFVAQPEYSPEDILHVEWTGWGRHSGWIDLNVQQRGRGGLASDPSDGGGGCAKWS